MHLARRGLIVVATAVVMLAFAAPAFAAPGYLDWSLVSSMTANGSSPHGGYQTSSTKCSVCHSVHQADSSGELLLQGSAADACTYCHVSTSSAYTQVYDSNVSNYSGTDLPNAHNSYLVGGVQQGVTCTQCHQVHAADSAMTDNPNLTVMMLRGPKTYVGGAAPNYDPALQAPLPGDSKEVALTKWCAGCHYNSFGQNSSKTSYYGDGTNGTNGTSHIMANPSASFENTASSTGAQVAFAGSNYCSSCHSSGYGTAAWPHYTPGVKFLESAGSVTDTSAPATSPTQDGTCLRCHRDGTGSGVGQTF